jgi:gluconate 2-dehydrogenase
MKNSINRPRILITHPIFQEGLDRLEQHCDIEYIGDRPAYSPQELLEKLSDKEGALFTPSEKVTSDILQQAKNLKIISNIAVGYNNFDLEAMTQKNIMGTNTPDVLTDTTADLGFALLMATARRMSESERWMRNGQWLKWELGGMLGVDVHHTTLGIMGMGRIGQALAKRALGFDMKIIYHNRTRLSADVESEYQAKYVDKETLLKQADHVILVMPYSPESHHFIGARELELMKPTATLINIARGGIVDDQALASALKNNRIFAAGLDVFEGEPDLISELLQVPNIVLTPHIGSASKMTRYAMMNLAIDNLLAGLHGEKPKNLLNPEAFQRL